MCLLSCIWKQSCWGKSQAFCCHGQCQKLNCMECLCQQIIRKVGVMNISPPNINPQGRISMAGGSPEAFAADRIFPDRWKHIVLPESHKPFLIWSASSYAWFSNDFVFSFRVEGLHSSRHPNSFPFWLTVTRFLGGNLRNFLFGCMRISFLSKLSDPLTLYSSIL